MSRWHSLLATVIVVGISGCAEGTVAPENIDEDEPTFSRGYPLSVAIDVERLAQALAEALGDPAARERLATAVAGSRAPEGKLQSRAFLASREATALLDAVVRRTSYSSESLVALLARVPDMDLYIPHVDHRRSWRPTAPIAVAALVDEESTLYAYLPDGDKFSIDRRSTDPSAIAVLLLGPAEISRIPRPSFEELDCGGDCGDGGGTGGGGGSKSGSGSATYLRADLFKTVNVCDNGFCWEGNEFEWRAFAPGASDPYEPVLRCEGIPSTDVIDVGAFCGEERVHSSTPEEVSYIDVEIVETDGFLNGDDKWPDYLTPPSGYCWHPARVRTEKFSFALWEYPEGLDYLGACNPTGPQPSWWVEASFNWP